ncbi:MAG: choice-of-anchor J domain-containing protein [Candidatus Delongbacteria bacterium]|nr:choice-of-anchor J domain-containing protein [Candidatus Delongbacteria bacterium]
MKKIALIVIMLFAISSYAETWLYGDFENGVLDGTVLYDHDGDANNWEITTTNPYAGTYAVQSVSAGLTPDNWLVSPQHFAERYDNFNYPHVKFMIGAADPINFAEHYQVLVSYTDTDTASFFPIYEETLTSADWKEIDIDLKPYFGEYQWDATMYVAIRHFDSDDQSALIFDDIAVYTEPNYYFEQGVWTNIYEGLVMAYSDMDMRISPYDRSMYDDVWDFVGMDVKMHYILNDGVTTEPEATVDMIRNPDANYTDTYICSFPGQPLGVFIEYWFESIDNSELSNVGSTEHFFAEWGEVPFEEGFEIGSLPKDWNVYSVLIDDFVTMWDHDWDVDETGANVCNGSYSISSASQTNFGVYETDDYLITPKIRLDGAAKLRYFVNAQTLETLTERYEVRISTVSGDSADIDSYDLIFEETLSGETVDTNWYERVVDLQAYSGQFVWIMFKHIYTPTGAKLDRYLNLDDVSVIETPKVVFDPEAGNSCVPNNPYEMTITATDFSGIESAKMYYSVDGGEEVEILMTNNGDNTYSGAIPAQVEDIRASWYLVVTDNSPYSNVTLTDSYDVMWFSENWYEWGAVYTDEPDGYSTPWIAAIDWDFGSKDNLYLNKFEVGFDGDVSGMTWKLVEFDKELGVPTDNVIGTYEGVDDFYANYSELVLDSTGTVVKGHVALCFYSDGNDFLWLDESGDKSHSWQYTISEGWKTNTYGAFFIRMYVSNSPVGINGSEFIASTTELSQNYPNPFNPTTSINFFSKESGKVNLTVFNVAGEKVASLVNGNLKSGYHKINFDASKLNSGVYYYTLITPKANITKKMVLVK